MEKVRKACSKIFECSVFSLCLFIAGNSFRNVQSPPKSTTNPWQKYTNMTKNMLNIDWKGTLCPQAKHPQNLTIQLRWVLIVFKGWFWSSNYRKWNAWFCSKNSGTPKSSISIGFSIINYKPSILEYPFFGGKHPHRESAICSVFVCIIFFIDPQYELERIMISDGQFHRVHPLR